MSQTRDKCPQRNWSSIRHIEVSYLLQKRYAQDTKNLEMRSEVNFRVKVTQMVCTTPPSQEESTHQNL